MKKKQSNNESAVPASLGQIGLLVETSWEVCNKIGGIYTVLSTKAAELGKEFGDRLVFIGPDVWSNDNPSPYFKERKTLLKNCAQKLKLPYNIKIRVGRWDIPGNPAVILVDFKGMKGRMNHYYGEMWNKFHVDSLHAYGDYDESCEFAIAASIVIGALAAHLDIASEDVVAHFDEWTTGMGLLHLRMSMPEAATVFTTHATSIGRSICGNGKNLYQYFTGYNGDQMAAELNMESKHSLEKAAAMTADCFTTVSEVTARECEQLLDKRPDIVTPNGFDFAFVPKNARYNSLRRAGRNKLLSIAEFMTGRQYPDDTLIIATSGRNEYRNKGLDLFLDAMAALSALENSAGDVVAFILVPAWMREPSGSLLNDLYFNGNEKVEPDYITHRLNNEDSDSVMRRLATLQQENMLYDVKVIYVPCYLTGDDGIVNISYYDLLPALDLTVFGSYYEPWGYTPLESVAFGVPTITTDKAGFGVWVEDNVGNGIEKSGVVVLKRDDNNYDQCVQSIAQVAHDYQQGGEELRKQSREKASTTAHKAEWQYFIEKYNDAFEIALSNAAKRGKHPFAIF